MLLRPDGDDVLCIGQTSHAWISGQMARAWAEPFEPYEEVCLAAEQHDVGMAEWDLAPSLNEKTGLPHSFMEMSFEVHSALGTHPGGIHGRGLAVRLRRARALL